MFFVFVFTELYLKQYTVKTSSSGMEGPDLNIHILWRNYDRATFCFILTTPFTTRRYRKTHVSNVEWKPWRGVQILRCFYEQKLQKFSLEEEARSLHNAKLTQRSQRKHRNASSTQESIQHLGHKKGEGHKMVKKWQKRKLQKLQSAWSKK